VSEALKPYLVAVAKHILNPIIGFMFVLALALFFYGLVRFILDAGAGNESAQTDGKRHMVWGVVGIFIMVSVYGILTVVCNTIGCSG
jgi:hypothetical protein